MGKLRDKIKTEIKLKKHILPSGIQPDGKLFMSSSEVGDYLVSQYGKLNHEVIVLLFFRSGYLVSEKTVFGNNKTVSVDKNDILHLYMISGADALIIAHNHPSGIALPSDQDTIALAEFAKYLSENNILLYDNIIFEKSDFISYRESGLIPKKED